MSSSSRKTTAGAREHEAGYYTSEPNGPITGGGVPKWNAVSGPNSGQNRAVQNTSQNKNSGPPVYQGGRPSYNQSTPGAWNYQSNLPGSPSQFHSASQYGNIGFNAPGVPNQFHSASQHAPQGWDAPTWQGFNAQDFQQYKDPGYEYRMAQGQQALMRQAAAGSGAFGGAAGKALVRYGQQQGANEFAAARNRAMQDYQTGLNRAQLDRGVQQQDFMNQQGMADRRNQFGQQQFQNRFNISDRQMQAQQQTFSNFNSVAQQQNAFNQQQFQNQFDTANQQRRNELESYKIAEARAVQNRAFNMQDLAQENSARAAEFAQLSGMSNQGLNAVGITNDAGNRAMQGQTSSNAQAADAAGSGAMGAANAGVQGYQMSYNAWRDQASMSAQMSAGLMGMAGTIIGAAIM